ncbi:MAG: S8 family serine peptidase, partial [Candidatus Eisenbacteria bacterium]|nr:S8 family serine peptidase [Candidatus Eisenbacteria bacterium]
RVEPVALARLAHDPPAEPAPLAPPRETAGLSAAAVSYGQTAAMMSQIGVPAVHDSGFIGTGVRIAILDEGFNFYNKHEATRTATVVGRRDFVDHDNFVTDTTQGFGFSHGTWTMGCMAGNKPGTYVGSAFGAQFLLARTEDSFSEKPVEMVNWGMAVEWADSAGADLISSSLGYTTFPDSAGSDYTVADMNGHTTLVSRYAEIAASKGILVVNSAGNEGSSPWRKIVAPADVNGDSLIAVGAVDAAGVPASFSSHGPSADGRVKPDLAARGKLVPLCSASGDPQEYVTLDGTSFSCPIVAGLAACLLQARPAWTPTLVIKALRETASRFANPDTLVGYGIPNGLAALRWIPDTAAVPPASPGAFSLSLTGPNPFDRRTGGTTVAFAVGAAVGDPRLRVFDCQGRRVVGDLSYTGDARARRWTATWSGLDDAGRRPGAGVYFIRLEAGGRHATVRVVSLR